MNLIFQYKHRIAKHRIIFRILGVIFCLMIFMRISEILAQDSSVISFSIPVNIDSAAVYAGPGINYYKTSVLTRGETVEVFLRNAEGWCAVRPPAGSFSWVNAKFVHKNADNVGTIISNSGGNEVPIRVGGPSIMKSSVIQVGLTNGKLVKILGEMSLPGGTNWYKISPPPGEFRWIHENSLMQDETIARLPTQLTLARKNLGSMSERNSITNSDPNSSASSALPSLDAIGNNKTGSDFVSSKVSGKSAGNSSLNSLSNSESDLTAAGSKSTEEFYRELSGLNNEFFNAVNKGSSDAFYQDLSDRSAFLFQSAKNNEQRVAVKQLYDNIETQRKMGQNGNVTNESSPGSSDLDKVSFQSNVTSNTQRQASVNNSGSSRLGRMEFAFAGRNSNGFGNIFRRPSKKSSENGNSYNSGNNESVNMTNNGGFSSNYIPASPQNSVSGQGQFSRSGAGGAPRNYNRNFWGTSTPNLVPPPSYNPVETTTAPEGAKVFPSENKGAMRVRPSVPELSDSLFALSDESVSEKSMSYFKTLDSGRIKQVAAEMTSLGSGSDSEKNVTKWRVPSTGRYITDSSSSGSGSSVISNFQQFHTKKQSTPFEQRGKSPDRMQLRAQNDLSQTSQKIVEEAVRNKTFDAIGRLGYFPNPPEGCPPYVLVRQMNGTSQIVCYLTTESGQKLDQFIGQTIGIKGKKGVIRRGNETKTYYCAQTIFSIK